MSNKSHQSNMQSQALYIGYQGYRVFLIFNSKIAYIKFIKYKYGYYFSLRQQLKNRFNKFRDKFLQFITMVKNDTYIYICNISWRISLTSFWINLVVVMDHYLSNQTLTSSLVTWLLFSYILFFLSQTLCIENQDDFNTSFYWKGTNARNFMILVKTWCTIWLFLPK